MSAARVGFTFIFPWPDDGTLRKRYNDYGRQYYSIDGLKDFLLSPRHCQREIGLLSRTAQRGTLLDVGVRSVALWEPRARSDTRLRESTSRRHPWPWDKGWVLRFKLETSCTQSSPHGLTLSPCGPRSNTFPIRIAMSNARANIRDRVVCFWRRFRISAGSRSA